ncbi:hypothetical protein Lal_00019723 [Lupinus albus]|nr:hypothetical protein Lal_00019723 [Lupinus albus]
MSYLIAVPWKRISLGTNLGYIFMFQDEDNNPPRIASIKPQFNPSTTMGTQSTRTPASHAMKQSYITLASVPFKTFDATRADTTLILSRFIPTSGIFRPPSEKVFEAYHAPQSTPTSGLTPSGSYSCTSQRPSKGSASVDFSDTVQKLYGGKSLDSVTKSDQNLQPKSSVTKEFEESGKNASIPKTSCTESESMGSQKKDHDAKNTPRPLKIVLKMQNYRLTRNQQCNEILGNGQVAHKETGLENCNVVDEKEKCAWQPNSTNLLNQNLGTDTNASGTNPQLQKLENERRKERKRQQDMEPFKRGKIPRETETHEELHNRVENLRNEVSELRKELLRISEESKEVEKENESLVEELIEKYGEESIADLISKNPSAP